MALGPGIFSGNFPLCCPTGLLFCVTPADAHVYHAVAPETTAVAMAIATAVAQPVEVVIPTAQRLRHNVSSAPIHERTSSMVVLGYTLDTEINAHCEPARWYILLLYGSELLPAALNSPIVATLSAEPD